MIIENNASNVPDWVPFGVRNAAHFLLKQRPPAQIEAVITRLLCDSRMERVWRELTNRKRKGYESSPDPLHESKRPPAIESWQAMAEAESQRAAAYRELGNQAAAQLQLASQSSHKKEK
jgi:hypothetical protein